MNTPSDLVERKYGLVLSGGGILFATHAGVIAALDEWGSSRQEADKSLVDDFDVIVGTSAGALYAAFYAAGYEPAQIEIFAELFTSPELSKHLFDVNWTGAAAAFARHDFSLFRGALGGFGVLTLFETVLSFPVRDEITKQYKGIKHKSTAEKNNAKAHVLKLLQSEWEKRRKEDRNDPEYFQDLITFGDIEKELYLIGVSAFTGQKFVFCKVPQDEQKFIKLEQKLDHVSRFKYLNVPEDSNEQDQLSAVYGRSAIKPPQFHRFEHRIYNEFDTKLYCKRPTQFGPQLPLALAVRASSSFPLLFEPTRIERRLHGIVGEKKSFDLFLDGGLDDSLSLSVAADVNLGHCSDILGIFLGNLGYRLPNPEAVSDLKSILLYSTYYLGDAILDLQHLNRKLNDNRITIIDALPKANVGLTDTKAISILIEEGRSIAAEFRQEMLRRKREQTDPYGLPMDTLYIEDVFLRKPGQWIFLSEAARVGTLAAQAKVKGSSTPTNSQPAPQPKVQGLSAPAYSQPAPVPSKSKLPWILVYGTLFLGVFGTLTLLFDVIYLIFGATRGGTRGRTVVAARFGLSTAFIVFIRLAARGYLALKHAGGTEEH